MQARAPRAAALERTFWVIGLLCGLATLMLGLVVIVGWHTGSVTLIQVMPGFVPMQYNTALGFVFCGAGLALLSIDYRLLAIIAGVTAAIIGGLTLIEYIFTVELGIDEMFMEHNITVKTSHPGRMAPNTAVCFVLMGIALGLRPSDWAQSRRELLTVLFVSLSFGLAWVALSGYLAGLETAYGWGNLTRMAVHTAVGFIVVSAGLLLHTWSCNLHQDSRLPRWLPIPIAVTVLTATINFWQALEAEGAEIMRRHQDVTSISSIADVLLIVGTLLALALAIATMLAQKANRSVEEVALMNAALRDEVQVRKKAEAELAAHGERLEDEVAERTRDLKIASEAAEAASHAKSVFLANMSHELRTPLNAVIGYSEMMAEDLEADGQPDYVADLMKINASGKHLLGLINDVLDLSKIEAGREELHIEHFNVALMLDEVVSTVTPLAKKRNNQIDKDYDSSLGTIRTDLTKMRQTLFNLLSNAIKFTQDGKITLTVLKEMHEGSEVFCFRVTDTGIGIAQDKLEEVFKVFTQADKSTTRNYGGTGLGLTLTRHFCEMMGGTVTATSKLGEGSSFIVRLPVDIDASRPAQANIEETAVSGATIEQRITVDDNTVLIIDDDADARDLLRRTLEGGGYTVIEAASGAEGIDMARASKPKVVILDVIMPGMDGWETLRALKSDPELLDIPVVMSTIVGNEAMAYSLGAAYYLPKPVDRGRLLEVVQTGTDGIEAGVALIVEDDAATRAVLRRALEAIGWDIMEAENGEIGMQCLRERSADLILLDLMMPVMDGFEFMHHLAEYEPASKTPVIVITAKDLTPEEKRQLHGQTDMVIRKGDHDREKLLSAVHRWVTLHKD